MIKRKAISSVLVLVMVLGVLMAVSGTGEAWWIFGDNKEKQVKIGFLVKQPEESWFQDEWKYAEKAAEDYGFELVKIGATDGEKTLEAIDNLAAQGAQGFVICTPDVKLGPAIVNKAKQHNLKVISVDDRFVGSDGKPMKEVHHVGISAYNIGKMVGETLNQQLEEKGWDLDNVGYLKMTYEQLPTIQERIKGATDVLLGAGFPEDQVFEAPMKTLDTEGSFNAANNIITKHPEVDHWLVAGGNDSSVIGAVRALEDQGFKADDIVGVGINGSNFAINEFEKDNITGFYGSILLSAQKHGYNTSEMMYKWIVDGEEPPKVTWTDGTLITRENYKEHVE